MITCGYDPFKNQAVSQTVVNVFVNEYTSSTYAHFNRINSSTSTVLSLVTDYVSVAA